ncbi:hypothetical protein GCM10028791_03460 [Echinicola sediminis]
MKSSLSILLLFGLSLVANVPGNCQEVKAKVPESYQLIAHRGGVVNEDLAENSMGALNEAIRRGYDMVEIDVRLTKDSVFITHHD